MAQEFSAGEWIADGVLAALGDDPETSSALTPGKHVHVLLCVAYLPTLFVPASSRH